MKKNSYVLWTSLCNDFYVSLCVVYISFFFCLRKKKIYINYFLVYLASIGFTITTPSDIIWKLLQTIFCVFFSFQLRYEQSYSTTSYLINKKHMK